MPTIRFQLNDLPAQWDGDPRQPLLWALRDDLGLTGTKYGCGEGLCGACTVHLDGAPARACQTPMQAVAGRRVDTLEGLGAGETLHAVQQAWLDEQVPQCGYCQGGFIMATVALLRERPQPSDADIHSALGGHLCRCGSYARIRAAVHRAAKAAAAGAPQ
ncbi:(2Fe-2S)-binding protein [Inhella sp.]|uniref:(2Fe-2S)-binding protein n=1 Tax=Inhella sp. TaxID=1921806 RepID=UPI0035AE2D35